MQQLINRKPISISLFTGAFGFDLGLEQAGFHTVAVVEKDVDAAKTITLNRPHLYQSSLPRNIEEVSAQELLEEGGRVLDIGKPLQPGSDWRLYLQFDSGKYATGKRNDRTTFAFFPVGGCNYSGKESNGG